MAIVAEWDFVNNTRDRISAFDLTLFGSASLSPAGGLLLNGQGYAKSAIVPGMTTWSLEVWVKLSNTAQRGGGAMAIQNSDSGVFDSIQFGTTVPAQWSMGSNSLVRSSSNGFTNAPLEFETSIPVQLVFTVDSSGNRKLYRDGTLYATEVGGPVAYTGSIVILFGCSNLPCTLGSGQMLAGSIVRARLYNAALSAADVAASHDRTREMRVVDGLYSVVTEAGLPSLAACDMTTVGGGWTKFWWHSPSSLWRGAYVKIATNLRYFGVTFSASDARPVEATGTFTSIIAVYKSGYATCACACALCTCR